MPVSVITDVITWIEMVTQIGVTSLELGVLNYLVFENGWLDMIRLISFWLDTMLIKYTDKFYSYFDKLLGGTLFAPNVVERIMNGVYIFVAVIVLFRLMLLLMKYLTNPDLVSDEKAGAQSLVKRILLGMTGMLLLPQIFNLSVELQQNILTDNLFGQLLLDKRQLDTYEQNEDQMGRFLSFNVYQGFWNLDASQVNDPSLIGAYNEAIMAKDPTVFGSINEKYGDDYAIDYFPILSTVVLFYVFYLIIKYCLDVVVRLFKLFVLQMLGPIAISDYMINGHSEGMFKAWLKTTISAYAMLFVRIFSIWFVAFITTLMNIQCTTVDANGVCKDSMLYVIEGRDPDYLLKGIITIGLLAFLMDLPKLFSEIFGLDLEQDASVKGLMGKVGGAAKMVGFGALTLGGAAIGGAISSAKNLKQVGLDKASNKAKFDSAMAGKNQRYADAMSSIQNSGLTASKQRQQMNKLRKTTMKENSGDSAVQDYKAANRNATASLASNGGVFSGAARGLVAGAMNVVPGLQQARAGYTQGQASDAKHRENVNQNNDERNYRKSLQNQTDDINAKREAKEAETKQRELIEKLTVEADLRAIERDKNVGANDASDAVNSGKVNLEGAVDINEINLNTASPVIETTAKVTNIEPPTTTIDVNEKLKTEGDTLPRMNKDT